MATRTLGAATPGSAGDLDDTAKITLTDNDGHTRTYTVAELRTALLSGLTTAMLAVILDQGAADDEILTLRSSDVAHGMTTLTDTTTYGAAKKNSAGSGGLNLRGFSEQSIGMALEGLVTTEDATRSTAAIGAVMINALLKAGTTAGAMSADRNLATISNNNTTKFIFDSDGDGHADVAWVAF